MACPVSSFLVSLAEGRWGCGQCFPREMRKPGSPMSHSIPSGACCLAHSAQAPVVRVSVPRDSGVTGLPHSSKMPCSGGGVLSSWHPVLQFLPICSDPFAHLNPALFSLAEWKVYSLMFCNTVEQRLNKVKYFKT